MKDKCVTVGLEDQRMSTKLKSTADSTTIGAGFQDGGGASAVNSLHGLRPNSMDSMTSFNPDQNNDNYGKMGENVATSQQQMASNYNGGGFGNRASNNFTGDQHGGGNMANASSEYSQQSGQYAQYGQHNMRPGYPGNPGMPRAPSMPGGGRPGMSGGTGMVPPNYTSNQQRFLSGATIQQQGGPTPTLNQLLQNSNPGPRYPGSYVDYNMGGSGPKEMSSQPGFNHPQQQGWNGPQSRPNMNPYQQMPQGIYRSPVSSRIGLH